MTLRHNLTKFVKLGAAPQYAIVALFRRLTGVLVTIPVAHLYGIEFFGQLSLILIMVGVISAVAALGQEVVVFRATAEADSELLGAAAGLSLVVVPTVGFVLGAVLFGFHVAFLPGIPASVGAMVVSAAAAAPSSLTFFSAHLRAQERVNSYVRLTLVIACVNTTVKFALVLAHELDLMRWLICDLATHSAVCLFALARGPKLCFAKHAIMRALRIGVPIVPHGLFHSVVASADRFIIANFLGITQAGLYSAAYQIPSLLSMVMGEMNTGYLKQFGRGVTPATLREHSVRQNRLMITVVTITGAIGPALMLVAFPRSFWSVLPLIPVLCLSFNAFSIYFLAANVITMRARSTHGMWWISGSAALVNLIANVCMVPILGLWGAVLANVLTFAILGVVALVIEIKTASCLDWPSVLGEWRILVMIIVQIGASGLWAAGAHLWL